MADKQLETLAYRLKDLSTLRNLFSELNFDFVDKPVNKDSWNKEQKEIVKEAKIIASKDDYQIYYIQTKSDSLNHWKGIASKIIKENHGLCMICSHNPNGIKWIFSSLSKEFSKTFSESRHVPIDIKPDRGVPKTFVDFLENIKVKKDSTALSIVSQISEAFDSFAIQIHDELTVNVFEALKILSEGIILDKSNKLVLDKQTLAHIREPTFIFLYRIIFILYAEDRGIFPIGDKTYYEKFSIKWIKEKWILESNNYKKFDDYQVQKRMKGLFRLIEIGSEELGYDKEKFFMRPYYGRIFDKKINEELEKWNISNENFLKILDFLTRTKDKKGNYSFLDYSALETRHLGAIYEHLLEFHFHINDGKISKLPDAKQRKKFGSYYTSKHIVEYIVKNSIEPLIESIIKKIPDKELQIEKIFALKIIDPAMGSGHFLIGVIEYMAQRLCEIEFDEITEEQYIERKRDVVRRCIYGVDINPLAVDLAKLSLWLETLSSEKPLSFLSAHLKCGNSLIGTNIDIIFDKQTTLLESQKGLKQFKKNIKKFLMFESLEDDSSNAVRLKLEEYDKMQSKGTIHYDLKFLLDCKVAKFFGIDVPNWRDYRAKVGENSLDFYTDPSYLDVKKLSKDFNFFHWDLEFPQVFYDENGEKLSNGGFDAVVGNPPYFNLRSKDILKNSKDYSLLTNGVLNVVSLFIKKGIDLLVNDGCLGLIVPKSFLIRNSWKPTRDFILDYSLIEINDVGKQWKEVGLEQTIILVIKNPKQVKTKILSKFILVNEIPQTFFKENGSILTGLDDEKLSLIIKIETDSIHLKDISNMFRGITVHSSEYISEKQNNLVHVLGGTNVERFLIKDGNKRKPNRFLKSKDPRAKKDIFNQKRIINQRVASSIPKIIATIEDKHQPTDDTLNNIILNDENYFYEDIIAILNSDLITYYLRYAIINDSTLTVDLDRPYMGKIPIKNPKGLFLSLTSNILKNKKILDENRDKLTLTEKEDGKTATNMGDDSSLKLSEEVAKDIEKINHMVFKLYGLNEYEAEIIQSTLYP